VLAHEVTICEVARAHAVALQVQIRTLRLHRAVLRRWQPGNPAATAAGIEPDSVEAQPVADELVAAYARHTGRANGPEFRSWLLDLLESSSDRRYERYWQLLAIINDWPATHPASWLPPNG
jgi:hypothetical protein